MLLKWTVMINQNKPDQVCEEEFINYGKKNRSFHHPYLQQFSETFPRNHFLIIFKRKGLLTFCVILIW